VGKSANPALERRRLASELRRLRTVSQLTINEVADRLECSPGKISRIETGVVGAQLRDVRDLLEVYEVDGHERERLLALVREARKRGWWHEFAGILAPESTRFFGLEDGAATIEEYSCSLVPGLLQTEGYARALIGTAAEDAELLDRRTELRLQRQRLLTRSSPPPPRLNVVLHEAVLAARIGGPSVMAQQLVQLIEVGRLPNVTIRVLPLIAGAHAGAGVSYTIFLFADDEVDRPVVHIEHLTSSAFREQPNDLVEYRRAFAGVLDMALDPSASEQVVTDYLAVLRGLD